MDEWLLAVGGALAVTLVLSSIRAVARWRGGWRGVAIGVALVVAVWLAKLVLELRDDPSSHNLWPFEAACVSIAGLLVLGTCALARASSPGRLRASPSERPTKPRR